MTAEEAQKKLNELKKIHDVSDAKVSALESKFNELEKEHEKQKKCAEDNKANLGVKTKELQDTMVKLKDITEELTKLNQEKNVVIEEYESYKTNSKEKMEKIEEYEASANKAVSDLAAKIEEVKGLDENDYQPSFQTAEKKDRAQNTAIGPAKADRGETVKLTRETP